MNVTNVDLVYPSYSKKESISGKGGEDSDFFTMLEEKGEIEGELKEETVEGKESIPINHLQGMYPYSLLENQLIDHGGGMQNRKLEKLGLLDEQSRNHSPIFLEQGREELVGPKENLYGFKSPLKKAITLHSSQDETIVKLEKKEKNLLEVESKKECFPLKETIDPFKEVSEVKANKGEENKKEVGVAITYDKAVEILGETRREPPTFATSEKVQKEGLRERVGFKNLGEIPSKVAKLIGEKIAARERQIEIQLEPKNLGKITLKAMYGGQKTSIEIVCSDSKVLETIMGNIGEMKHIMEDKLGRATQVYIQKGAQDYLQQESNQHGQSQHQQNKDQKEVLETKEMNSFQDGDFIHHLRLGLDSSLRWKRGEL